MKILYAASEANPFIASGGLADVAASLPKALRARQQACRVAMPLYGGIDPVYRQGLKFVTSFNVPLSWRNQYCGVFEANVSGVKYYLLDNEYYFKRENLYGYDDDAERFAFFSRAVLEMLRHIDFVPEIIHCNDWQSAMIPVFLNAFYQDSERFSHIKTIFTIHNIQYQGKFGMHIVGDVLGLPYGMNALMEYDGSVNMMKAAIDQADRVTTVSPTYATEILDPWFAYGLDRFLRERQYKLSGILNGIDQTTYDPATDAYIAKNYTVETVALRKENKLALQKQLGLAENPDQILVGMVTRLVSQKGLDLVKHMLDQLVKADFTFAILGSGDYIYENFFKEAAQKHPDKVALCTGFDPALARQIYAGSDLFLMPSKSEPCGLSQMIALRYGAIPVVRATGGLKDSIIDVGAGGNGFTFQSYNAHDMVEALGRAKAAYADKAGWAKLVADAMVCDFGWGRSAGDYLALYKETL